MKRSFFITLAIYLTLFAFISSVDFTPVVKKTISLQHIKIKKCACKKCTCKKCPQHPKKPSPPPKKEIQWQPKKVLLPKVKPKKAAKPKRIKKHKKVVHKKIKKRVRKVVKKVARKPQKPIKQMKQKVVSPKPTLQPTVCKECTKKEQVHVAAPKPSYQKIYLQNYATKIKEAIVRHLYYPRIARKTKKQGVVIIRFELLPSKRVQNITIMQSSHHKILDRAAKTTIQKASKEFPKPKEKITIQIPIEYRLR